MAKTPELRDAWLQHLNILLVHQRTHDTDKVISRKDVVDELHMMSFQIGKLMKQTVSIRQLMKKNAVECSS